MIRGLKVIYLLWFKILFNMSIKCREMLLHAAETLLSVDQSAIAHSLTRYLQGYE